MRALLPVLALLTCAASFGAEPPPGPARQWWSHVKVMASDAMEGRDTGSQGYQRAAKYVVEQLQRAGVRPAGENGGWFQKVPLTSVEVVPSATSVELIAPDGKVTRLPFLEQVSLTASTTLPAELEAPIVFLGDAAPGENVRGKFVAFHNRGASPQRTAELERLGALGAIAIDVPNPLEPPRWPVAYARVVSIADAAARTRSSLVTIRLAEQRGPDVMAPGMKLRLKTRVETKSFSCTNVLGILPGSDPELSKEFVVVSAHLDGYGFGYPVTGDRLYNGAFDDSAYVATLLELAAAKPKLKRSLLFGIWTGEEKGLLGSSWYTDHLTLPRESIVANLNLDYLRPIFPLRSLTGIAMDQSTLGETAVRVGSGLGIRIDPDKEPGRGLYRRSDQFHFLRIGIPGIAFIFGYDKGSAEEKIYRQWYTDRYHKPADDLNQPVDFGAAVLFNRFYTRLVEDVANAPDRPRMKNR